MSRRRRPTDHRRILRLVSRMASHKPEADSVTDAVVAQSRIFEHSRDKEDHSTTGSSEEANGLRKYL